jgi:hypothetical protein
MKSLKFIVLLTFFLGAVGLNAALAQDDDPPPPMMSSFYEEEEGGDENQDDDSYNNSVTIDDDGSGSTEEDSYESTSTFRSEPKREQLRVYSGKHDGNNVIRDPRRD